MWSWMRVRASVGVVACDGVDDAAVLGAQAVGGGRPVGDRCGGGAHVGLDRRAQARHHRGDDDVAGCLGQGEMELGVESQELVGGQVDGIHRRQGLVRGGRDPAPSAPATSAATAISSRSRVATTSASGKPCAATCRRRSADIPPRGVAMMIAPGGRARSGSGADQPEHLEHAQRLAHAGAARRRAGRRARARAGGGRPGPGGRRAGRPRCARAPSATRACRRREP